MALINDFLSLIYPRHCAACRRLLYRHEKHLCGYCLVSLPVTGFENIEDNELERLLAGRIPVKNAFAFYRFEKSGRVQQILHKIKYEGRRELAVYIGNLYGKALKGHDAVQGIDLILPMPLHPKKQKLRGFNQSEAFAQGLSQELQIPLRTDILIKTTSTSTQTRKRKFERWENVEGVFDLANPAELKDKHVLLADDVITTGATMEAAWLCLKDLEGIKISVAAMAYASKY